VNSVQSQRKPPLVVRIPQGTRQRPQVIHPDQSIIITIDGPAGTGKSSVARELARRLGLDFLDTGAMYRAAAAIAIDSGLFHSGADWALRVVKAVEAADLHFDWSQDPPTILAGGRPIDDRIREADVTRIVSEIASIADLRRHMVAKQRLIARQHPRLVTEGRDQGSVVFPGAEFKFYLDAASTVRAARRAEQLRAAGLPADEAALVREIEARDLSDSSRADGPLIRPADAQSLDTSRLSFDEVVGYLEQHVRARAVAP
jgi:cytidylate kinase